MANNLRPRGDLHANRLVQPEFGARHPINYTEKIDNFFTDITDRFTEIMNGQSEPERDPEADIEIIDLEVLEREVEELLQQEEAKEELALLADDNGHTPEVFYKRQKRLFRVYDDPKRVGVSVLERRLARSYAQRQRVKWTRNDAGRIKGEIGNELCRMNLAGQPLNATFTDVVRVGDADENNARKLALILDQESEVAEFLVREHEIVINGISGTLKRFRHPYSDYIPHWTVARVNKEAGLSKMTQAVKAVQSMMPLTVELHSVHLFSEQDFVVDDY